MQKRQADIDNAAKFLLCKLEKDLGAMFSISHGDGQPQLAVLATLGSMSTKDREMQQGCHLAAAALSRFSGS